MDLLEAYMLLFTDTLFSNLAFNMATEIAIESMKIFGLYNNYLILLIASSAFAISTCINYALGKICYNILSPLRSEQAGERDININKVRQNKYASLLLILSPLPLFGNLILLFAGFCKIRIFPVMVIGTSAKFIYYYWLIM